MKTVATITIGILLVAVGVLAGLLAAPGILRSNTSTYTGPEYLILGNVDGFVGFDGWIAVTVNNTGVAASTIAKVLVNNVTQTIVHPSLPLTVAEDGSVVLNVTMDVAEESYQITLLTSRGNAFSISTPVTFGFMGSSSLTITNVVFNGTTGNANNTVVLTIKNTGTKQVTIGQVKINNLIGTIDAAATTVYPAGSTNTLTLDNVAWANGNPYKFDLFDTSGNGVGSYQVNSPGS